jgi:hypothetical protein
MNPITFQVFCFGVWSGVFSEDSCPGLQNYYAKVRFYYNGLLVGETF